MSVPVQSSIQPRFSDELSTSLMQEVLHPPKMGINSFLLTVLGSFLIALQGFCSLDLPNPLYSVWGFQPEMLGYNFQIPVSLFWGALMGPVLGPLAVFIFIAMGLLWLPLFSNGGGLEYIAQPAFGYLCGMVLGSWVASVQTQRAFLNKSRWKSSWQLVKSVLVSVLAVHFIGSLGLLINGLAGVSSWEELKHWWWVYTAIPLSYDVLAAVTLFGLVRLIRITLWWFLY